MEIKQKLKIGKIVPGFGIIGNFLIGQPIS